MSRARLEQAVGQWNPAAAVRYLGEHLVKGRLLNFDDWDGYLIETIGQEVFVDGRADIYEPGGVLLDYLHIVCPQSRTMFLLRKYQIDSCLKLTDSALVTLLTTSQDWKVAYRDKVSAVLVHELDPSAETPRRASGNKETMRKSIVSCAGIEALQAGLIGAVNVSCN